MRKRIERAIPEFAVERKKLQRERFVVSPQRAAARRELREIDSAISRCADPEELDLLLRDARRVERA
jgi:hypothetical protein